MLIKSNWKLVINYLIATIILYGCGFIQLTKTPIAATFSASKTVDETLLDRSFLTDMPCKAPCWYGLVLGKSTEQDVRTTLKELSFINPNTIAEEKEREELSVLDITAPYKNNPNNFDFFKLNNNILVEIYIDPAYDISLNDVINHWGPPDYITPFENLYGNSCRIRLFWLNKNIDVLSDSSMDENICDNIMHNKKIGSIYLIDSIHYGIPDPSIPRNGMDYPWPGFIEKK